MPFEHGESRADTRARRPPTSSVHCVSASWIWGSFSRPPETAPPPRRATRQLTICERCNGVRPRTSGEATSRRAMAVTRDLRAGRRNLRRGPVWRRVLRRHHAVAQRNRKTAARIVDLAEPLDDEGHQRQRLAGFHRQREDVADVRRIVTRTIGGTGRRTCRRRRSASRRCGPSTWAEGPWPDGPRIGSAARFAFCMTVTNVSVRSMARSPLDVVATVTGPPSSNAPAAPPQATPLRAIRVVREAVDVAEIVRVLRREQRARHEDVALQTGVIESSRSLPSCARPKPVRYCRASTGPASAHPQLQIPETVERVGAAAGRDAAAVLRPGRRVLDVPELAVSRREARDGPECRQSRRRSGTRRTGASCRNRRGEPVSHDAWRP